jgi:hypothetical protein
MKQVEAHATEFLSDLPEWRPKYLDRIRKMVLRDRNHPSIVMWSVGNESGWGDNLCAAIAEGKRLDPSRPAWMYGGNGMKTHLTIPCNVKKLLGRGTAPPSNIKHGLLIPPRVLTPALLLWTNTLLPPAMLWVGWMNTGN